MINKANVFFTNRKINIKGNIGIKQFMQIHITRKNAINFQVFNRISTTKQNLKS